MRPTPTHMDIAVSLVTCAEFARFVTTEGYFRQNFWNPDARRSEFWKSRVGLPQWGGDEVLRRIGFRWEAQRQPVLGVTWYEADAYCRFAGGRLPWRHELAARRRELGVGAEAGEWCGDWYNPNRDGPQVLPDASFCKRVEGWAGGDRAVPEIVGERIGFRVVRDGPARGV